MLELRLLFGLAKVTSVKNSFSCSMKVKNQQIHQSNKCKNVEHLTEENIKLRSPLKIKQDFDLLKKLNPEIMSRRATNLTVKETCVFSSKNFCYELSTFF